MMFSTNIVGRLPCFVLTSSQKRQYSTTSFSSRATLYTSNSPLCYWISSRKNTTHIQQALFSIQTHLKPSLTNNNNPTTISNLANDYCKVHVNGPVPITQPTPPEPDSFYRRPLPSFLIPFSSTEGKQLFKEALPEGHMESYWALAEQFHTQSEPAYILS